MGRDVCTLCAEVEKVPQGQHKVQPPVPSAAWGCRLGAHPNPQCPWKCSQIKQLAQSDV